jgi:hypothetical protein
MSARMFRTMMIGLALVGVVIAVVLWRAVTSSDEVEAAPMLVEYGEAGSPIPFEEQPSVGRVELKRSADGLETRTEMSGLQPNGVYTFWIVVYQGDGEFPSDLFVNEGRGVVAGQDGTAEVTMNSDTGDTSITGFYVDGVGDIVFDTLHDPLNGRVRLEVVYHGQSEGVSGGVNDWLADFWTGDPNVCANPLGTLGTGAVPEHPYCAGFWAATFDGGDAARPDGPSRAPTSAG